MLLPYEVVPTTFCELCAAPEGRSAGPPLSPSQGPPMPPPSLYEKVLAATARLTGALAWKRRVLLLVVESVVTPKPTYSTVVPTARPSVPVATGITGVPAGALKVSMQKSWVVVGT